MGHDAQAPARPPLRPRCEAWPGTLAWAVGELGALILLLLLIFGGATPATLAVLAALVSAWNGVALGLGAGLGTAGLLLAVGLLGVAGLGVADGVVLSLGLGAAGAGGGLVGRWRDRLRRQGAEAEAARAAAEQALAEARAELGRLMARLADAQRLAAVGTMSAQIAHQLRNPLTSIGLYIQLVGDELRDLAPAQAREAIELLDRVLNEQRILVEITDNYLRYARLPDIEPSRVDVNRTVGELVRFLRHELERKGIATSTGLAEGLRAVQADRRLLRFALMNLLKNAVEAMRAGGRLRVRTAQHNGAVEVHVSDTGPGIPPEQLDRVFEPFYTTKDAGSGLGLSLSRQIVEKHAGSLTCQSMVGVGTTFTVRLPAGEEPPGHREDSIA